MYSIFESGCKHCRILLAEVMNFAKWLTLLRPLAGNDRRNLSLPSSITALQSCSLDHATVMLYMSFWQPRSVLQLVILGFSIALAPLCMAVFFTIQTMGELTDKHLSVTRLTVDVTRKGRQIQRDLLELERRARQFIALGDEELAQLFENERIAVVQKLEEIQSLQANLPSASPAITELLALLAGLELPEAESTGISLEPESAARWQDAGLEQSFILIGEASGALQRWLQATVDQVMEENAGYAEILVGHLQSQLLIAAAATIALLIVITYLINRPIKDLTHEIQQLGTRGLSHTIDISGPRELRELGIRLEWLRQQLRESEQQKEQFLRHISHELKTPLASLREGADLLADLVPGRLSRQQEEIVDIVRQNGIELQRLIENLVDYSQIPHKELILETINLRKLWGELVNHYRIGLDKKALHLTVRGSVEEWVADRSKLRTTLDNLLSNAVNYTPEDGRIELVWYEKSTNLVMELANSGEKIPPEDEERVFEPFFQSATKRTGPIKGSGIGLSVARECMQSQGGSLSLVPHGELPVCFRLVCPAH